MNKNELYEKITAMVPIRIGEKEVFRSTLKKKLDHYYKLLEELNPDELPQDWDTVIARVKQLIEGINRAIESEYRGTRHSAYTSIKNQLDGYKNQRTEIRGLSFNTLRIQVDTNTYRMRKIDLEDQHNLKRKDLFHIPLDMKGCVTTQRYSVPGYPCLYLAKTIYGCWEEMGRPDFGKVMVSKLINKQEFNVLDLRIPTKKQWEEDMVRCIQFFPFIIASMVQVKNPRDSYKPEYLIPQLLTEWIISRNRESKRNGQEEIIGIAYTSAHKNTDFDYPEDSIENYAIPVLKPLDKGKYCSRLTQLFTITPPTYYDIEVLKQGQALDFGHYDLNDEKQREENLKLSPFGAMQEYLKEKDSKHIGKSGEDLDLEN